MTDDELDRALLALPLEEPPPGLRARILAATVLASPPAFRWWELWLIGSLLGLAAWRCIEPLPAAIENGLFASPTVVWLALGLSAAWCISNLALMPQPRLAVTKRT